MSSSKLTQGVVRTRYLESVPKFSWLMYVSLFVVMFDFPMKLRHYNWSNLEKDSHRCKRYQSREIRLTFCTDSIYLVPFIHTIPFLTKKFKKYWQNVGPVWSEVNKCAFSQHEKEKRTINYTVLLRLIMS